MMKTYVIPCFKAYIHVLQPIASSSTPKIFEFYFLKMQLLELKPYLNILMQAYLDVTLHSLHEIH